MKKYFLTVVTFLALIVYPAHVFAADISTLQTQLMTYLPYILIGGAIILLISIVGILLSKKKDKSEEVVETPPVSTTETIAPVIPTPEIETPVPVQPVNMDEISNNLYTPAVAKPTIQEAMESTNLDTQPIVEPTALPTEVPVSEQTQTSDFQAILQGEASTSPMGPVTNHNMEENTPETPSETAPFAVTPTVEATPTEVPVPDLQQFVNNQVADVPPMATPVTETPAPAATPMQDFTPATADTTIPTPTETPPAI